MGPADFLWHLLNLFALGLLYGALAASGARLLWRRRHAGLGWARLLAWSCGAAAIATILGLVFFGRDGRIATYALMVLAVTLVLSWLGRRKSG
ncbi:MAG TPA: hypothetical protein PKJ45_03885 [Rubrivivax sp.]|nr:hypothetical protein [Burkholderiales bacterium]HNU10488.1 hypothetical protein [Rubrivivax sp.]